MKPKPVGVFKDPKTRHPILILPKADEAREKAIERVAGKHGVSAKDVTKL